MPRSKRFRQLVSELRRLEKHFLPKNWSPIGVYSQRQFDLVRAYRILAHAEIEFYLENVLLDLVNKKYDEWKMSKKPSYVTTCLVIAIKTEWQDSETEIAEVEQIDVKKVKIKKDDDSINQFFDRAVELYREVVKSNNGILKRDLKKMLLPIGIALSDLDQTWLNNMNSFGGQRGFVAHSSRITVRTPLDPKNERANIDNLVIGLEQLDIIISSMSK